MRTRSASRPAKALLPPRRASLTTAQLGSPTYGSLDFPIDLTLYATHRALPANQTTPIRPRLEPPPPSDASPYPYNRSLCSPTHQRAHQLIFWTFLLLSILSSRPQGCPTHVAPIPTAPRAHLPPCINARATLHDVLLRSLAHAGLMGCVDKPHDDSTPHETRWDSRLEARFSALANGWLAAEDTLRTGTNANAVYGVSAFHDIAFASDLHVILLSLTGVGGSGWRFCSPG